MTRRYQSTYPKNWRKISRLLRENRAHDQCEWRERADWQPGDPLLYDGPRCTTRHGEEIPDEAGKRKGRKRYLMCCHIGAPHADGTPGDPRDKSDVRPQNLRIWCPAHHLLFDQQDHIENRRKNRTRNQVEAGQRRLL